MTAPTLPKPFSSDATTVTFSRSAWEAHVARLEDLADAHAADRHRAWVASVGPEEAARLCYTDAETTRLLEGVVAVTIWRERAGLSQRALAAQAEISPSYLAEIEGGKKPGSVAAISKLARVLNVPMEHLVN